MMTASKSNFKFKNASPKVWILALLILSVHSSMAQDLLDDVDASLETDHLDMDELDINGKLTPAQRLEQTRKRLEDRNRQMVDKKIENIRVKQEIELTKKLQNAFTQSMDNMDQVNTTQSSVSTGVQPQPPVQPTVIERIIEVQPEKVEVQKLNRVTPYFGMSTFKGQAIDFESKSNLGAKIDYLFLSNVSLGLDIGYTSMDITDTANSYADTTQLGNTYGVIFPNGREISFGKLLIEANTKYFLTMDSKVRPYVGAGLGYNRVSLKYESQGTSYVNPNNGVQYGSEGVSSNFVSLNLKLGTEFDLTDSVALGFDLGYTRALSSGLGTSSQTTQVNQDQVRLEKVSDAIMDSDNLTINAGMVLKF